MKYIVILFSVILQRWRKVFRRFRLLNCTSPGLRNETEQIKSNKWTEKSGCAAGVLIAGANEVEFPVIGPLRVFTYASTSQRYNTISNLIILIHVLNLITIGCANMHLHTFRTLTKHVLKCTKTYKIPIHISSAIT